LWFPKASFLVKIAASVKNKNFNPMKTPLKKLLLACGLWLWDVVRNAGLAPYASEGTRCQNHYRLSSAIAEIPTGGTILRSSHANLSEETWNFKRDKRGTVRYPRDILRRLGR